MGWIRRLKELFGSGQEESATHEPKRTIRYSEGKNSEAEEKDKVEGDVDNLVESLHWYSMPSYQNMVEEFPELSEITTAQYDFFMTCAAVTSALMGIEVNRSSSTYERAKRAAEERLQERWPEDGVKAVLDCNDFVNRALTGPEEIPEGKHGEAMVAALGMWIVWNLYGERPRDDQMRIVSVLGRYAYTVSGMYWSGV